MNHKRAASSLPRYSQFLDVREPPWRRRACGVVALMTVIDGYQPLPARSAAARASVLIRTGVQIGAYDPEHGWRHAGLVRLARARGFRARRFDWTEYSPAQAMRLLGELLKTGPIIASLYRNLLPGTPGHLVVVTHMNARTVRYHDPDSKSRERVKRTASLARFRNGWKQRGIVVRPVRRALRTRAQLDTL
ncbi:MAG: papain-like cysteine protease family protein [bacterium]|nr:papain-like cysteine protease family protein [bacterium]